MLRICMCLSHYYPHASGAERQAHWQARELVRRGHAVSVVTRAVPGLPDLDELDGVDIYRWIRPRELGPLFGLTFLMTLRGALRRLVDRYDVVHCHQALWEAAAAGSVLQRMGKASVVQPAAGGEYGELRQWSRTRGRSLLRRWILRNSHFVAISREIEQELREFGVPPQRLTRLASGVDVEMFRPADGSARNVAELRVLFLGRLHEQKNLAMLLDAWVGVRSRVDAQLWLAGDGPQRAELESLARQRGIGDSVRFLGATTNPLQHLQAADLFVLPSVAEGMSNSLLEAMSVGLPVVASRIGGNEDVVSSDVGVLVDAHDVTGWTRALVELLLDSDRRRALGAAARRHILEHYSIGAIVDRYVAIYEQLGRSK